jgi:23S rRNA pseudouridine2605 synthase
MSKIRLNKYIADCGIASRRKADFLIENGSVKINGKTTYELGVSIDPTQDQITVKGKKIQPEKEKIYYILNKPKNMLTTVSDPHGRPTVMEVFKNSPYRLFPVGRLDWETEGLLIITNDGDYSNYLMNPKSKIPKTYEAKLDGQPTMEKLEKLLKGVSIEGGGKVKALSIKVLPKKSDKYDWVKITIEEGKNRQIRKMFAKIGFDVKKLKRISIGELKLTQLKSGDYRLMTATEVEKALLVKRKPKVDTTKKTPRKTSTKRVSKKKTFSKKKDSFSSKKKSFKKTLRKKR